MTATPYAPAARTTAARSASMPPIAITRPAASVPMAANGSRPSGAPERAFDGVAKIGPSTT